MPPTTIAVEVDSETAERLAAATPADRRKLQLLLRLRLRELLVRPARPLIQVMEQVGREAESRGLNSEILESLLHDD